MTDALPRRHHKQPSQQLAHPKGDLRACGSRWQWISKFYIRWIIRLKCNLDVFQYWYPNSRSISSSVRAPISRRLSLPDRSNITSLFCIQKNKQGIFPFFPFYILFFCFYNWSLSWGWKRLLRICSVASPTGLSIGPAKTRKKARASVSTRMSWVKSRHKAIIAVIGLPF